MTAFFQNIMNNLPALVVVLPLLMAPVVFLIPKSSYGFFWGGVALLLCLFGSFGLGFLVKNAPLGVLIYEMGGWGSSIGIAYKVTSLNLSLLILLQFFSLLGFVMSSKIMDFPNHQMRYFYTAWMLSTAGFSGLLLTNDIFNMFVFLEITSLSSYILTSFNRQLNAYVSSFNYLIIGSVAASLVLFGIGFLYARSGILNLDLLFDFFSKNSEDTGLYVGLGLVILGLAVKTALFPLHNWLPMVYRAAKLNVVMLFSVSSTKISAYLLIALISGFFVANERFFALDGAIFVLASAGILCANFLAALQKDWRGILAYSSVGQLSYALLAIVFLSSNAVVIAVLQLLAHGVAKGTLFFCLGIMEKQHDKPLSRHYVASFLRSHPLLLALWMVGVLSLIGVPLTFGFSAKWGLFDHLIGQNHIAGVVVIFLGSVLSVFYGYRLLEPILFRRYGDFFAPDSSVSFSYGFVIRVLAVVLLGVQIVLGIWSGWLIDMLSYSKVI